MRFGIRAFLLYRQDRRGLKRVGGSAGGEAARGYVPAFARQRDRVRLSGLASPQESFAMYIPRAFAEDRPEELRAIMQSCALPVLVSPARERDGFGQGARLVATHLPLMLTGEILVGHMARANDHWKTLDTSAESLAIFTGANGYISPSLYASKRETGKVVPTWNYEAVHAYGRLEIIEEPARILAVVSSLTDHYEAPRKTPWRVSDAPEDYIAAQLKGIVALVLHITGMQGVRKLSQNKSQADREGVIAGQRTENPLLAERMLRHP